MLWPRHHRDVLELIAAIIDRRWALVVLAFEVKRRFVETGQQQPKLLFEQFAVFLGIEKRGTECLDLARMVAAADSHDDASVGDNVRHGVIFSQPDRMPHRQNVKGATEFQAFGLGGEPQPELDQIREDLITFALKMVLGGPQHVETELIHELCDVARRVESFAQAFVRIAPLIRRRAFQTDILELDLADIQNVKFSYHAGPRGSGDRMTVTLKGVPG